jgi:hypothetical protein
MSGYSETITCPQAIPSLHFPFKVGQRVKIRKTFSELDGKAGVISGIAAVHIAFSYIVKMDEKVPAPLNYPGEDWECICMIGGCLELEEK